MCDTLCVKRKGTVIFGKNSDRRPNEIQFMEYHAAADHKSGETIRARYASFPQVRHTNAVVIARPEWIWGAEIGVNEHGLCIGNEALWSNTPKSDTGLMGMDLLRAALERASTADEAVEVITTLLETYGQGGNGAFDIEMHYDNAYMIADPNGIVYLETCGNDWALKRGEEISISNCIVLGQDADRYRSGKPFDFRQKYIDGARTLRARSLDRRALTQRVLSSTNSVEDVLDALRLHNDAVKNAFAENGQGSVCMHYGDTARNSTTQAMAVELAGGEKTLWLAGASQPCVTLFKPFKLNCSVNVLDRDYWIAAERYRRRMVGRVVPEEYYQRMHEIQRRWIEQARSVPDCGFAEFSATCIEEEKTFCREFVPEKFAEAGSEKTFLAAWADAEVAFNRVIERCADFCAGEVR